MINVTEFTPKKNEPKEIPIPLKRHYGEYMET